MIEGSVMIKSVTSSRYEPAFGGLTAHLHSVNKGMMWVFVFTL